MRCLPLLSCSEQVRTHTRTHASLPPHPHPHLACMSSRERTTRSVESCTDSLKHCSTRSARTTPLTPCSMYPSRTCSNRQTTNHLTLRVATPIHPPNGLGVHCTVVGSLGQLKRPKLSNCRRGAHWTCSCSGVFVGSVAFKAAAVW